MSEPALKLVPTEKSSTYMVSARAYRPKTFTEVLGQEALVTTLTNAIDTNRLPHAFIFTGVRGVGKTTTARLIARSLNCVGEDGNGKETINPCGVCDQCKAIDQDRHMDVIEMDAASRTGVDDVREVIESSRYKAVMGRYKIFIIDEVHMLSKSAFNALLKTLEEPPAHVKFIFATTEINKVPATVLSRCMRFNLKRITVAHLMSLFTKICKAEDVVYEEAALQLIARAADGSARDGLSILDQAVTTSCKNVTLQVIQDMLGLVDQTQFIQLFENLVQGKPKETLQVFDTIYSNGGDPVAILKELLEILHTLTMAKVSIDSLQQSKFQGDNQIALQAYVEKLSIPVLTRLWQMSLKGLEEAQMAPSTVEAVRMILIRLCYVSDLPTPEEIAKILNSASAGSSSTTGAAAAAPSSVPSTSSVSQTLAAMEVSLSNPSLADSASSNPQTFEELLELVSSKKEPLLLSQLTHMIRLVRFGEGELVIEVLPMAPMDLPAKLSKLLTQWTGRHWRVTTVQSGGQKTIAEKKQEEHDIKVDALTQTQMVRTVIDAFPGAKIESIH